MYEHEYIYISQVNNISFGLDSNYSTRDTFCRLHKLSRKLELFHTERTNDS